MFPFPSPALKFMPLYMLLLLSFLVIRMTIKGGTSQACAACKYQRRRCTSDCPLSPFFPANQPETFQNAHRLFGVSNITKILQKLNSHAQREEAMKSIIYESDMRKRFPVHGCWGIICQLNQQLQLLTDELHHVKTRIAFFKGQIQEQSQLDIMPGNGTASAANHFISNDACIENMDSMVKNLWPRHTYFNNISNSNSLGIQFPIFASQALPIQEETELTQDYDDIPFDTFADDRQSYIESKEACQSSAESISVMNFMYSAESSLRDTTQTEHVSNNELKSAAACFKLTSGLSSGTKMRRDKQSN